MHYRKLLSLLIFLLLAVARVHADGHFTRTPDGITVYPAPRAFNLITVYGRDSSLRWDLPEVAIPFLLSSWNYDIVWDNYSLTSVGEVYPYKQLSAKRLYSAHNHQDWLTACYHNDKLHPGVVNLEKAESVINYAYPPKWALDLWQSREKCRTQLLLRTEAERRRSA